MHVHSPIEDPVEWEVVFLILAVSNGDDLLKALDEDDQHEQRQGNGAQVDDEAKCSNHDEGEDASGPPLTPSAVHVA